MAEHVPHHRSADDQYAATPPDAGYEHTDAATFIIVKFLVWLAVAAGVIHVGLALLFGMFSAQRTARVEPQFPLAAQEGPRLPPEPRLQRFPREDILNFRTREEAVLNSYGWVDRDAGTVHIPIQDAMRLVLERQLLPSRPDEPAAAPSHAPSDSSGGRTLERSQ